MLLDIGFLLIEIQKNPMTNFDIVFLIFKNFINILLYKKY